MKYDLLGERKYFATQLQDSGFGFVRGSENSRLDTMLFLTINCLNWKNNSLNIDLLRMMKRVRFVGVMNTFHLLKLVSVEGISSICLN